MKSFTPVIIGWLLGLATIALGGLAVVELGLFDTTATTPHSPLIAWAAHKTFIQSVRLRASGIPAPSRFTPDQVIAGARDYDGKCAVCHGGPGVSRQLWISGMTPTPPYILDAANRWTPAQLKFIIGDGVKMTAMPGWRTSLSDQQIWNLVAFIDALPYLSAADYKRMRASPAHP